MDRLTPAQITITRERVRLALDIIDDALAPLNALDPAALDRISTDKVYRLTAAADHLYVLLNRPWPVPKPGKDSTDD